MAQIVAEVKGLATHVTSLSEREGKRNEKVNQILTHIEEIETRLNELEGAVGEGVGAHRRKSSGGSRNISNEHPLLKVCCDTLNIACAVYAEDISLWCIQFFFRCVEWSGPGIRLNAPRICVASHRWNLVRPSR
jgi:hypothetical protein